MLQLILTLDPTHQFFGKFYTKPIKNRKVVDQKYDVFNNNGLFTGDPDAQRQIKNGRVFRNATTESLSSVSKTIKKQSDQLVKNA